MTMKLLSLCLALCAILTVSQAHPINNTALIQWGLCKYELDKLPTSIPLGRYTPQCDMNGNFQPRQIWGSTGYSWCVEVFTGKEIPNTRTPPVVTPVDCGVTIPCPKNWSYFSGTCFIFHPSPKTWPEAQAFCSSEEANLASIHSYEENEFVRALTQTGPNFPETWIGGYHAAEPSFWLWNDGSLFDYENWFEETNIANSCLKMNFGLHWKWMQASCNEPHPFVCGKKI
ncbi:type-2 ice-structuring protein-like [Larimichthys crocea]|uniref:type-2 ice-structuring protein-like n=1 Tax=Larimichthys crocea TaxID=215358 RepID=UPI000F5F36D3|nr:type-2 ice-structuring protein-like [Larimichthys crocea]